MQSIRETSALETVFEEPVAVLYKHSPLCGTSARAAREVRAFKERNPAVPVYMIDVIRDRAVAREVTRRLSVRHESPQALLVRHGAVAWSGSHGDVTADALARQVTGNGPADSGGSE